MRFVPRACISLNKLLRVCVVFKHKGAYYAWPFDGCCARGAQCAARCECRLARNCRRVCLGPRKLLLPPTRCAAPMLVYFVVQRFCCPAAHFLRCPDTPTSPFRLESQIGRTQQNVFVSSAPRSSRSLTQRKQHGCPASQFNAIRPFTGPGFSWKRSPTSRCCLASFFSRGSTFAGPRITQAGGR